MAGDVPLAGIASALVGALMQAMIALARNPFILIGVLVFIIWLILEEAIKSKHKKKSDNLAALLPYLMASRR